LAPETSPALELDFVVAYPRVAEVGKRYLMTVDLRAGEPVRDWPYAEEEYALHCMLDTEPAFRNEPLGQAAVVLHRFGGTYGPARFVLTALAPADEARIRLTLVNAAGMPLRKLELTDVRVVPAVPVQRELSPPMEFWIEIPQGGTQELPTLPVSERWYEGISKDTVHVGISLFRALFRDRGVEAAWRRTLFQARESQRSVRLLIGSAESQALGLLYDPEERHFFVHGTQPRIQVVRSSASVPQTRVELPARPRLLLAALDLSKMRLGGIILQALAQSIPDVYDVYMLGREGPVPLRSLPVDPKAWQPWHVNEFCYRQPEEFPAFTWGQQFDILHLVLTGLQRMNTADAGSSIADLVGKRLPTFVRSGGFQVGFFHVCRMDERGSSGNPQTPLDWSLDVLAPGNSSRLSVVIAPAVPLVASPSTTLAEGFYRRLAQGDALDEALYSGDSEARPGDLTSAAMNLWARPGALDPVRQAVVVEAPRPRPAPRQAPPGSIGWLHLSNLMVGDSPESWSRDMELLLADVDRLYGTCGPWDLVLVAGDLSRTGMPQEFEQVSAALGALRQRLVELGMEPLFLVVPGNHDFRRSKLSRPLQAAIEKGVLLEPTSKAARAAADSGFRTYAAWHEKWSPGPGHSFRRGLLHGDFSMVVERNGVRLGVIGLNTVPGLKSDLVRTQLDALCDGGFEAWSRQFDACMVLAHEEVQPLLTEWSGRPPGSPLLLYLTGSGHEAQHVLASTLSTPLLLWRGRSLFPQRSLRIPGGYSAGRLTPSKERIRLRVWPRRSELDSGGRLSYGAERAFFALAEDEGFEATYVPRPAQKSEGAEDWAVVVGISRYPGMGDLDGPETDARAFYEWVTQRAGVPPQQVRLILSSDFEMSDNPAEARPKGEDIEAVFDALYERAEDRSQEGEELRVGRRLYIFLAGHGFSPTVDEPALLTANATMSRTYHVPGRVYATWFLRAGLFDEVLLFMDCSRESYRRQVPLRVPPYIELTDSKPVDRSKLFFGFATKASRLSREKRMPDGQVRGVFSTALLAGLNGAAADTKGEITARSLANYLYDHMKELLSSEELKDPDVPQEPELIYDTNPDAKFLILRAPTPAFFSLDYQLDMELRGQKVTLMDRRLAIVDEFTVSEPRRRVDITRGLYHLKVSERQWTFEVTGSDDVVLRIRRQETGVDIQLIITRTVQA
jgi:hypothetical protein